jgi:hypothetical protein
MDKILFALGLIVFIASLYGNILYFINWRKKPIQAQEEEENEYQCFVCKNKFVTNKLMSGYEDGRHPLCSDKCVDIYITSGFKYVGK